MKLNKHGYFSTETPYILLFKVFRGSRESREYNYIHRKENTYYRYFMSTVK
ncbi:MAG: hypothetical protein K8T10_14715 [Candidatus Eremiobacteraeota bacterium]|nr:hypothetical protein [Candidatus Eremiobacteraeota bacterium]